MKDYIIAFSLLIFGFLFFNIFSTPPTFIPPLSALPIPPCCLPPDPILTLYYNAASDTEWSNTANWWTDATFTAPGSVPTSNDNVFISGNVDTNVGVGASVNTMNVSGTAYINIPVSLSTDATFNDSSHNSGAISGNASFFDSTIHYGSVSGDACFALTATNSGSVGGTTTACAVSLPAVTTNSSTVLSTISADLFGEVTDTGGESANTTGFQFGLDTNYGGTSSQTGAFVRGTFDNIVNSLSSCSTYHFRAFATNSAGTSYGNDLTFTLSGCNSGGRGRITPPHQVSPTPAPTYYQNYPVSNYSINSTFNGTLAYGSTGNEVKSLQSKLNIGGYHSGPVDGIFGPITEGAVIRFQIAHGLVGDGIAGPLTLAALNSI